MTDTPKPRALWAIQLRQAWFDAGKPSYREIARQSGISHETIRQALNGTFTARRRTVKAIADVLCSPVISDQIVSRWEKDQEESDDILVNAVTMPNDVMWMVMPEELYGPLVVYFKLYGFELRRLAGKSWAVVPYEGEDT